MHNKGSGKVQFIGGEPMETANALEALAADLRLLAIGQIPNEEMLIEAPLIRNWGMAARPRPCLLGQMIGHPTVALGGQGVTSELFAIDPHRRWARSLSRFYELGPMRSSNSQ